MVNTTCSISLGLKRVAVSVSTAFSWGEDRKIHLDNESDLRESVKQVMDDLVDNNPEAVKKMFHQLVDMRDLTIIDFLNHVKKVRKYNE